MQEAPVPRRCSAAEAVSHSNRRRCDTPSRHSVPADRVGHVVGLRGARKTRRQQHLARRGSDAAADFSGAAASTSRRGPGSASKLIARMTSGMANVSSARQHHSHGEPGRTVQASASKTTTAGAARLRRRLSSTFQRSSAGSGFRRNGGEDGDAAAVHLFSPGVCRGAGTVGKTQRAICQSPRTQRCSRRA